MAVSAIWRGIFVLAAGCGASCSSDTRIDLFPSPAGPKGEGGAMVAPGGGAPAAEAGTPNVAGSGAESYGGGGSAGEDCCDCSLPHDGKLLRFRFEKLGVLVAWPEGLSIGPERTFEAWIYPVSTAAHLIINKLRGGSEDIVLRLTRLEPNAYVYSPSGTARASSATPLEAGAWHHVALVQDATSLGLFVDGAEAARVDANAPGERDGDLRFGGGRAAGFDGYLADVRLSSIARYGAPFVPPTALDLDDTTIGLWRFDEGAGTVVCDHGKLGLHGTIDATLAWEAGPGRP